MNDTCELSTYDELIEVITNLRFLVREKRRRDRMTLAAVAAATGLATSTVLRFESGRDLATDSLISLIRWVGSTEAVAAAPGEAS